MGVGKASSERRARRRESRRVACEIQFQGKRHGAVIVNLSPQGLLVRTNASPPAGTPVRILLRRPGGRVWQIEARVVRRAAGCHPSARGLGLEIVAAPPAFQDFLAELSESLIS